MAKKLTARTYHGGGVGNNALEKRGLGPRPPARSLDTPIDSELVTELPRQRASGRTSVAPLAITPVEVAFTRLARADPPQQFHKVCCRLDREWLDCIVLKTHFEQLSSLLFHRRDRQVTFVSRAHARRPSRGNRRR